MENVIKAKILPKYKKCWKDGNIAKRQKMLERRKSYQNTENVSKTEILLKDRKFWKDGNLTKIRKILEMLGNIFRILVRLPSFLHFLSYSNNSVLITFSVF